MQFLNFYTMAKYETPIKLNSDRNLLQEKHHQNLLENYASLKTTSNFIQCKVANDYKCQIVNTSEISMAFNNYLEKMSSSTTVKDEKLLKICEEIKKLHNTIQIEKNDGITTSNCMSESDLCFETNTLQNKEITALFSEENLTEFSSISLNNETNNNLTSDDFLTMHEETSLPTNEQETVSMQNSEKLQAYEMVPIDLPILQHPSTEHLPRLKKSEKEQEMIQSDQIVRNSQSSTERPYVCSKCQMAFKRNLHLKRHFLVTHTPNKNFKCDTCGKQFSRKDYLDKHITGHQKKYLKIKLLEQGIVVRTKIFSKSNK